MRPKTIEQLHYFEDKVCTIFTSVVNRQFDEDTARRHFIVRVKEIDPDGIWGTNLVTGTVCFFAFPIISIQEELELNPNNPEHVDLINQCKGDSDIEPPVDGHFIDIEALAKLASQTKKAYDLIK